MKAAIAMLIMVFLIGCKPCPKIEAYELSAWDNFRIDSNQVYFDKRILDTIPAIPALMWSYPDDDRAAFRIIMVDCKYFKRKAKN